jgi:hypothetical protein
MGWWEDIANNIASAADKRTDEQKAADVAEADRIDRAVAANAPYLSSYRRMHEGICNGTIDTEKIARERREKREAEESE